MPERIVARAAGTGKTRAMMQSIINILQNTDDEELSLPVLILTSSPITANDIESRLRFSNKDIGTSKIPVMIHTIESLCKTIFTEKKPDIQIISELRSWLILKRYIQSGSLNLKSSYRLVKEKPSFVNEILELIQAVMKNSVPIEKIYNPDKPVDKIEDIKNIYNYFVNFCNQHGYIPIFQVIPEATKFLNDFGQKFSHIFVDQYEDYDTGEVQFIDALIRNHPQVTILVDSVRKPLSDISIIISDKRQNRFDNSFSKHINRFLGKTAYPELESDKIQSVPVTIAVESTVIDEAEYISRTIKKMVKQNGRNYSDFAILCRDNGDFGTIFHDSLRNYSIPCSEIPDFNFNPLVIFVELCLKAIANYQDDELVLKWLLSRVSGLDRTDVYRAYRYAKENRQEFIRLLMKDDSRLNNLLGKSYQRLKELLFIWDFARNEIRKGTQVWEIIKPILEKAGAISPKDLPELVSNFISLVRDVVEVYQGSRRLQSILNNIDEAMLQPISLNNLVCDNQNVVKVMSIWESRGLEFPIVFIPGMVQDFFPARHPARQLLYGEDLEHARAILRNVALPGTMSFEQWWEHEKMLFYIGMTRAREQLFLTLAESYNREIASDPSRLLSELLEGQELSAENCSKYNIAYQYHTISNSMDILPSPDDILSRSEFEIMLIRYIREIKELETYKPEDTRDLMSRLNISDDILPPDQMPEYPLLLPKDKKFNNSSIRDFLSCPRKYFFQHILKIESDQNMDAIFGSLIHDVLKKFHRSYPNLMDYGEDELKKHISEILTEEWDKRFQSESLPDNLQIRSYWGLAHQTLMNYLNGEFKIWDKQRTCIKTEDEFQFNFSDKYILTGRIDRIDDYKKIGNEIVDFKVSNNNDAESALKSKFLNTEDDPDYKPQDYQLPIYYFASQNKPGIHPVKLVIYQLLTYSKRAEGPFRREIDIILDDINRSEKNDHFITKGDLDSIRDDMTMTLDRIVSGDYPPQPREDRDCQNCGFVFICNK